MWKARWALAMTLGGMGCEPSYPSPEGARVQLYWSDAAGNRRTLPQGGAASGEDDGSGIPSGAGGVSDELHCLPVIDGRQRVGDKVFATVEVEAGGLRPEHDRRLELVASGALLFDQAGNDKTTFAAELLNHDDQFARTLQVGIVGVGVGELRLAFPPNTTPPLRVDITARSVTGAQAPRLVRLIGAETQVRVRLCSTLPVPANVTVQALSGTLSGAGQVTLSAAADGDCPSGYQTTGALLWTGHVANETLVIVSPDATRDCSLTMPSIVTAILTPATESVTWVAGEKEVTALVPILFEAQTTDGQVPLVGATVAVDTGSSELKVAKVTETDASGTAVLFLTAPKIPTTIVLSALVADRFRVPLKLESVPTEAAAGAPAH